MTHINILLLWLLPPVLKHVQQQQFPLDFLGQLNFNWVKNFVLDNILKNSDKLSAYLNAFYLLLLPYPNTQSQFRVPQFLNLSLT